MGEDVPNSKVLRYPYIMHEALGHALIWPLEAQSWTSSKRVSIACRKCKESLQKVDHVEEIASFGGCVHTHTYTRRQIELAHTRTEKAQYIKLDVLGESAPFYSFLPLQNTRTKWPTIMSYGGPNMGRTSQFQGGLGTCGVYVYSSIAYMKTQWYIFNLYLP